MDYQGGQGNGAAWYCNDFNAPVLLTDVYANFEGKPLSAIDVNDVKVAIGTCNPSAQAAPVLNYLYWLLTMVEAIA